MPLFIPDPVPGNGALVEPRGALEILNLKPNQFSMARLFLWLACKVLKCQAAGSLGWLRLHAAITTTPPALINKGSSCSPYQRHFQHSVSGFAPLDSLVDGILPPVIAEHGVAKPIITHYQRRGTCFVLFLLCSAFNTSMMPSLFAILSAGHGEFVLLTISRLPPRDNLHDDVGSRSAVCSVKNSVYPPI